METPLFHGRNSLDHDNERKKITVKNDFGKKIQQPSVSIKVYPLYLLQLWEKVKAKKTINSTLKMGNLKMLITELLVVKINFK